MKKRIKQSDKLADLSIRAEEDLRAAERLAQSTIDALSSHIAILDERGLIIAVNRAWRDFAQANLAALADVCESANYLAVCDRAQGRDSEEAAAVAAGIRAVLRGGQKEFSLEYPCHSPNEIRWFIVRITCFHSEGTIRIVVTHENITERKKTEISIQENIKFLQLLIDTIPNPIFYKDKEGIYKGCNAAFEKIMGTPRENLVGKTVYDLAPKDLADVYYEKDMELLDRQGTQIYETQIKYSDGSVHDVIFNKATFSDLNGSIAGLIGVILDITERKRMEEDLREREQRYRVLFEGSAQGILAADVETGRFIYANPSICRMFGYSDIEFLQLSLADIHPKNSLNYVRSEFESMVLGEKKLSSAIPCLRKDGTVFYADISSTSAAINGRSCLVGFFADVTGRREMDEEVKKLARFIQNNPAPVIQAGHNGAIIFSNPSAQRIFERDLYGEFISNIFPSMSEPSVSYNSYSSHEIMFQIEQNINNKIFLFTVINDQSTESLYFYGADITTLKKMEEQYRKLSRAVEQSASSVIITDTKGIVEYVNPKFSQVSGYSSKEVFGRTQNFLKSGLTPSDVYKDLWDTIITGGEWRGEICNRKKDGELFWESESISSIKNKEGVITHFVAVKEDITERKLAEAEINLLRTGIEQAHDYVVITDIDGAIQYVNPAFERITGYSKAEAIGQNPRLLKSEKHPDEFYKEMWVTVLKGEIWHGSIINKRKNGELFYEEATITPVKNKNNEIVNFVAIKRDVSKRIELENNIHRLRRENEAFMRHEIKNLLSPVKGYAELLLYRHAESLNDKQKSYLSQIKASVDKTIHLVDYLKKLQDFELGRVELKIFTTNLKDIIDGVLSDLALMAEQNKVVMLLDNKARDAKIKSDINLIPGVFHNLLKNAIEHVTDLEIDSEKEVKVAMFNEKDKIIVKINNRGEPIPPEKLELFFEKFNSDRDKKKDGTGLGTTYAYLVTKAHGGDIAVESNEKEGTTVTVAFDGLK